MQHCMSSFLLHPCDVKAMLPAGEGSPAAVPRMVLPVVDVVLTCELPKAGGKAGIKLALIPATSQA